MGCVPRSLHYLRSWPSAPLPAQSSWTGVSSNLWTDPGNWSAGVPDAATTALFNAATANMSISLGGATQTVGAIQFDNTGGTLTSSYTLGQGGGGAFVIGTAGTATTGAISMTSTVTNAQTIADPISFSIATPFITNLGTTGSSLTLGSITTPSGSVTSLVTGVSGAIGTSTNSTTNLGNVVLAATGGTVSTALQTVMTLTNNGTTGLTAASTPPFASGTVIGQGVISGGIAGPGSTNFTTTVVSVLINGGGSQAGASNGSAARHCVHPQRPVYQPNVGNTYTGGTDINSNPAYINITGNSVGTPGDDSTSGPFGTGTIFLSNTATTRIRPVGGSYVIYNGITEVASGLTMGSAVANDANSLTFAGPIVSAPANSRFISNGYSIDENTTTPVYGATMILGLASNPSTINTPTTTASNTNFTAITGPIVINDVIQSPGATTLQSVIYNSQNQNFYSIQINSLNTYNGSTTLGGANYSSMGAILIGSSSNGLPIGMPGAATAGPFSTGTLIVSNTTTSPLVVPVGADQTVANAVTLTSSLAVANGWYNVINLRGTQTATLNTDPTGSHSLTFSGPITLSTTSRTLFNVMSTGTNLTLGLPGANASTMSLSSTLVVQGLSGYPTGTTVINDLVQNGTAAGGLTVQFGAVVQLTNANTYTGTTTVTNSAAGAPGGTLFVNNTTGSGTGTGAVNVNATAGPGGAAAVGTGGTLGGTGTISGLTSISSATPANQGGIVSPGPGGAVAGTLNVGSMNWQPFGRYVFAYNGSNNATGGGVNNLISGSGTLDISNLSGGTPFDLNLQPIASGPTTQPYVIANFSGGITGAGFTFGAPFATGTDIRAMFTSSGMPLSAPLTATIIAGAGGPNAQAIQLSFSPVPEPGFILAACGGLTALVGWRRSRRRTS